jgi:hypothetical protein
MDQKSWCHGVPIILEEGRSYQFGSGPDSASFKYNIHVYMHEVFRQAGRQAGDARRGCWLAF